MEFIDGIFSHAYLSIFEQIKAVSWSAIDQSANVPHATKLCYIFLQGKMCILINNIWEQWYCINVRV